MENYLVLDIGGSYIKYALMNEAKIIEKRKVKTPTKNLNDFLKQIESLYRLYEKRIVGLAISMPGAIDVEKGLAIHGGAIEYIRNLSIVEILERQLNIPVSVENDGKSAAIGEVWKGKLQGVDNGVVFLLGTGIGGGIIANGELIKGKNFSAAEFSYVRTNDSRLFSEDSLLGLKGSSVELTKTVALAIGENPETFNGEKMFSLIRKGNHTAKKLFQNYCRYIVGQIVNLQMVLDPTYFVIGGGISEDPLLIESLNESLEAFYKKDPFMKITGQNTKLVNSELGNEANLWGALYQFVEKHS